MNSRDMNSSNASSDVDYEVFLSFRGADTRQGFTDVLYEYMSTAEIRVFRDDDELAIGDKIESILGAIDSSKICIPIFSRRFAESKWCLLEVTRMVELKKTIVPVFYKVTSDDVKLKTSLYLNDLQKLEEKYGEHQVQKWKDALKKVVSNKGRTLGVKGYIEFCKELVDEVLSKLGPRKILDIDYFVGDANKARAMDLLDMMGSSSSHQVIYVGIHGMGGIGKTTLTKLIHNEYMSSFDHCAFLPDIREYSKCNGTKCLPKYLYDNVEPKSVAAFSQSRQIPNTFKNKTVLLILDDVDSCEQIQEIAREPFWFGSGSRIIVTTRDRDVLRDYEEESDIEMRYLEMEDLDSSWSLELFSKCAFRKDSPPSSYLDLSKRVVVYTGGLPLTIMVIGKLLRRYRTVGEWEELIEKLDKNPPKEVKDRLLISYEKLEENEKRIFLDIACLFIGESFTETSNVFYMWKACDLYPRMSLEVLQARSLVKIDEDNELQMHDQLRDFGRDIVRAKFGGDVTKQSRLWENSQVIEVLKCKKMKENIEAMQRPYRNNLGFDINVKEFISFDNLKYLALGAEGKLQGDFSILLPKLIWLQAPMTIEPRTLVPSNLVILNLTGSDFDENGDIWSQIQVLKKLKVLNLSSCTRLERTPVFGENMVLERLTLFFCCKLKYIDPSIAKLQHLNYLSFKRCSSLVELPESLGELHALRELDLSETSITRLPDSIGRLEKLQLLNLELCERLERTPVFGENMILESLDLSYCVRLNYIDPSIGDLRSLVRLDCTCTKIKRFPAFLGRLEKLQELTMSYSEVQELPKLPTSLTKLIVDSDQLNKVADLSNLQHLTYLEIVSRGAAPLDWNGSFASNCKLQTLIIEVPNISRLPGLTCCSELIHLGLKCKYSFEVLPNISGLRKLVSLKIVSCQKLKEIPGIQKLQCLTSLYIIDCPSLKSLGNLRELQALVELKLISCGQLEEIPGLGELRGLTKVKIEYCHSLRRIDNLTALKELKEVRLIDCLWLTEIPGLGGLPHLDSLHIESCPSLLSLENLSGLQLLKNFVLVDCQRLTEIPGLDKLQCPTMVVIHEDGDSLVIFGRKKENLNSNSGEEAVKEKDIGVAVHSFTKEKVIGIGGEAVVGQLGQDAWTKQQSSLTRSSVLVLGSNESVTSSDGSRSFPISELEGKVVGLYYSHSRSLSCIEFILDLLDVYEKLKATSSETAFEIVYVHKVDQKLFWQSFGSIPWLSLHPSSDQRHEELSRYFKVSRLSTEPTLVIVGEDGKVLNFNAVDMIKQHGARAYPFTLEKLQQITEKNNEVVKESEMLWPKKLQHHLHIHQLVPTLRRGYICDCCNLTGKCWSYYCEECDFDLHCQCASLKNINTTEQSSILEERDLQSLEIPTIDSEGNNEDMQGQLLDLHNSQDDASCSEHVNLHAKQSFVCSGSQTDRSCLAWSCCLPFLSFFRS